MKLEELKQKSKEELAASLKAERESLNMLRFNLAAGKVKNIRQIHQMRKEIARILTILKQKEHK